jgi:LPS export ABC transporter protein LptC
VHLRAAYVKIIRRSLIGVIIAVLLAVLFNYQQILRKRNRVAEKNPQMLGSEMVRSAESIEYSEYKNGVLRFKIHARRLLEARMGKNLLEGIEAYDFNPDGSTHNEIRSRNAEYDRDRKIVDFSGDVRLFLDKDIELRTNSLHYDLNANVGSTPDPLQFYSGEASGTARGARFDQRQESLSINSSVDLVLTQRSARPGSPTETEKLHAISDRAYCAEMMRRIVFQGRARIESNSGTLSSDSIDVALSPDRAHVTALTSTGNAVYRSTDGDETRILRGDSIVFSVGPSGELEKVSVSGQAVFSLKSPKGDQDLRGGEIDLGIDPARGSLTQIQSSKGVLFRMERGTTGQTLISGDRLDARLNPETKNLESVQVINGAKLSAEGAEDSPRNELEADEIRMSFREINGRAVYERLRGEGSAEWISMPKQDSAARREPARTLSASSLEMVYSGEGDFWESGSASGKVIITENSAGPADHLQVRRLRADSAQFHFFPLNGRPKDMSAKGEVQITYEKRSNPGSDSAAEEFQTASDNMKAVFALKNGDSLFESVAQWGNFSYKDASWTATAGRCDYDAVRERLLLKDSPMISGSMGSTTGEQVDYDQKQKLLSVHGGVRSILNTQKGEGSFFGSSKSSSHGIVTADEMQYWTEAGRSRYSGRVQWLSETQQLQAEVLEMVGGGERVEAQGEVRHFVAGEAAETPPQTGKSQRTLNSAKTTISIQSSRLKYMRASNTLTYSGNVTLRSGDLSLSAANLDAILDEERRNVERASAYGKVLIRKGEQECKGEKAEWYLNPGKYVVTGKPAEVFDPGRGRSFARRLTSFTADDTILLESQ